MYVQQQIKNGKELLTVTDVACCQLLTQIKLQVMSVSCFIRLFFFL